MILRRRRLWLVLLAGLALVGGVWVWAAAVGISTSDVRLIRKGMTRDKVVAFFGRQPDGQDDDPASRAATKKWFAEINANIAWLNRDGGDSGGRKISLLIPRTTTYQTWYVTDGCITVWYDENKNVIGTESHNRDFFPWQWYCLRRKLGW